MEGGREGGRKRGREGESFIYNRDCWVQVSCKSVVTAAPLGGSARCNSRAARRECALQQPCRSAGVREIGSLDSTTSVSRGMRMVRVGVSSFEGVSRWSETVPPRRLHVPAVCVCVCVCVCLCVCASPSSTVTRTCRRWRMALEPRADACRCADSPLPRLAKQRREARRACVR